jgi:antibiotic biosynthesis monooxygenase (ABM) superfamily enzyme
MHKENSFVDERELGSTVVITHRVRNGHEADYENWLNEIGPICKGFPGNLDLQIIRPIAGLTSTYTIVIRFDTREHVENWIHSEARKQLIDKARTHFAKDDDFFISSGLDFWFTPEGARAKVPVRWKQFLITWSVIYPLVLVVPLVVVPVLRMLGAFENRYFVTLCATGVVVFLTTYVVMPNYTKLIKRWLFD